MQHAAHAYGKVEIRARLLDNVNLLETWREKILCWHQDMGPQPFDSCTLSNQKFPHH